MNILKTFRTPASPAMPATRLVWRRKHGRGAWLSRQDRPVWTLTPVAPR